MCDVDLKEARLLACLALSSSAPREKKRGRELTRKKKMKEKNKRKKKIKGKIACILAIFELVSSFSLDYKVRVVPYPLILDVLHSSSMLL